MSGKGTRTRSQRTLYDFQHISYGHSPLKVARNAARNDASGLGRKLQKGKSPADEQEGHSRGEQVLSPDKLPPQKRSSSPTDGGSAAYDSEQRDSKRARHDTNDDYSRSPSPEQGVFSGPFDFSSLKRVNVASNNAPPPPETPSRRRTQSVPPVSPGIPHIDLKRVPPSPWRAASSSPMRPQLRFNSMPRSVDHQDGIADMVVEQPGEGDASERTTMSPIMTPVPDSASLPSLPTHNASNVIKLGGSSVITPRRAFDAIRTPANHLLTAFHTDFSLSSPLTPLPRTPFFSKDRAHISTPGSHLQNTSPAVSATELVKDPPDNPQHALFLEAIQDREASATPRPSSKPLEIFSRSDAVPADDAMPHQTDVIPPTSLPTPVTVVTSTVPPPENRTSANDPATDTSTSVPAASSRTISQPPISRLPRPSSSLSLQKSEKSDSSLSSLPSSGRSGEASKKSAGTIKKLPSLFMPKAKAKLLGTTAAPPPRMTRLRQQKIDAEAKAADVPVAGPSRPITPGASSHQKSFSFAQPTASSKSKVIASPTKKPVSLPKQPSPMKFTSPVKPASVAGTQRGSVQKHTSLSNLSQALERLKMPPPPRPGTSIGFVRDVGDSSTLLPTSKDDLFTNGSDQARPAKAGQPSKLMRANTVGHSAMRPRASTVGPASRPKPPGIPAVAFGVSGPISKDGEAPPPPKINVHTGMVGKSRVPMSHVKPLFGGVGMGRVFQKASKKSSLPTVEGSPVKGGSGPPEQVEVTKMPKLEDETWGPSQAAEQTAAGETGNVFSDLRVDDLLAGNSDAEFDPHDSWKHNASRRASLASQLLSQTLSQDPHTPPNPPRKPPVESQAGPSSTSPTNGRILRSASVQPSSAGTRTAPGALGRASGTGAHVSASRDGESGSSEKKAGGSLKLLKKCKIFVDVRTDDGDDAGGLFVDMLRGMGAKIVGRVGSSCTHIVFKNGLLSTLTKYRVLDEPRPLVVGIAWVVECVEKRKHVEEDKFLIDLEGVNVAGVNKRRRSMLPKQILSSAMSPPSTSNLMGPPPIPSGSNLNGTPSLVDRSVDIASTEDTANNSLRASDDGDDLPPLERARRRGSMMTGR